MKKNKAIQCRIYPSAEQRSFFARQFGCCRLVYNKLLDEKIEHYKKTGKSIRNTPAHLKKHFPFLKEMDSQAFCNEQIFLEDAFKTFFERPETGFPKFKSKHRDKKSYTTDSGSIKAEDGRIFLPKIKWVKARVHRPVPEHWALKKITITQTPSGQYFASLCFEYETQVEKHEVKKENVMGLDFGMKVFCTDSDGKETVMPLFFEQKLKKIAREERKLSHMQKHSSNWYRQLRKINRLYQKAKNQRKDFQHKLSLELAESYDCICIEDLSIKEMMKQFHAMEGWTNRQKEAACRKLSDESWYSFTEKLAYKLEDRGKALIRAPKNYASSQICSECGAINPEVKDLSVREWVCPVCGKRHSRDVNAAVNLRNYAISTLGISL